MPETLLLPPTTGSLVINERTGTDLVGVVTALAPKEIDTARCMTFDVIGTGNPDRAGDILVPSGCDTSEHRQNPVVLFNHARSSDVMGMLPIGIAVDKSGAYGVQVEQDAVYSWTRYSERFPLAVQLFALTAEGILRGNSVAARPVPGKTRELPRRLLPDKSSVRCFQYDAWVLHEYSKTPNPVNAEALTVLVEKGRVGGEQLDPILKSYLSPMCLKSTTFATGGEIQKSGKNEPDPTAPLKQEGAAMTDEEKREEEKQAALRKAEDDEKKKKEEEEKLAAKKAKKADDEDDEKKKDEVEKSSKPLKPTLKAMASVMQAARDFRVAIAKAADETDDDMALVTLAEADEHALSIEKACNETMVAKGCVDAPTPLSSDILKSQLAENKVAAVAIKGHAAPPRLIEINKSATPNPQLITVDPVEFAKLNRQLTAMARRAGVTV